MSALDCDRINIRCNGSEKNNDEDANMDDGTKQQRYSLSFTGSGGEFFKIWIVNILLTIVTVYIYSAWAKVRTKRYFYGNTVLDGSSFEYHAKPLQILLSRLVAAALFVAVSVGSSLNPVVPVVITVVLFLIIPWAIWRSTKFNMRMTSYRNVRFGFDGSVWPLYLYNFLLPLLVYAVVAFGVYIGIRTNITNVYVFGGFIVLALLLNLLISAFTHNRLSSYFLNHYLFGKSRFEGKLSLGKFFTTYVLASVVGLGTLIALAIIVYLFSIPEGVSFSAWMDSIFNDATPGDSEEAKRELGELIVKLMLLFYAYVFLVGFYVTALVRARVRNHVFGQALLDKRVTFESTVPVTGLWWVMFSNLLLIIFTLGLARPFTQVRMARFMARHTSVMSPDRLDDFVGEKRQEVGAFGDELGDAFDIDMAVGF